MRKLVQDIPEPACGMPAESHGQFLVELGEETSPLFRHTEHTHTSMHSLHFLCWVYTHPRPLPTPDTEQQNDSSCEGWRLEISYPVRN